MPKSGELFQDVADEAQLEAEIACVRREVAYRRYVYPRRVGAGRMSPDSAREQIDLMQAVLNRLTGLRKPRPDGGDHGR